MKTMLFYPLTEFLMSLQLSILIGLTTHATELFFLRQFRLTECCNFVHNSTPYTHQRPDFDWAEAVRIVGLKLFPTILKSNAAMVYK